MSFRQDTDGDISIPYTSPPQEYPEQGDGGIEEETEEDEDDEYGEPVVSHVGLGNSSSGSSSSDLISPAQQTGDDASAGGHVFDCPFSINRPVPDDAETDTVEASSSPQSSNLLGIDGIDSRMRGDSLSSMSTNPSAYIVTPALSHMNLPAPNIYSPPQHAFEELPEDTEDNTVLPFKRPPAHVDGDEADDDSYESQEDGHAVGHQRNPQPSPAMSTTTRSSRISRPVDIDIRSISTHAQAEALVQQAQQRVFDFINSPSVEDVTEASPPSNDISLGGGAAEGRLPLSARLAAYGQSLKIEQRFKEEAENRRSPRAVRMSGGSSRSQHEHIEQKRRERSVSASAQSGAKGLDRTFSLEERHHVPGSRNGRVRRPHTAGGTRTSLSYI